MNLTSDGLVYEADPRHVDLLLDALNLSKSSGVGTAGVKEADVEGEAEKSADGDCTQLIQSMGIDQGDSAPNGSASVQAKLPSQPMRRKGRTTSQGISTMPAKQKEEDVVSSISERCLEYK